MFESRSPAVSAPAPFPRWLADIGGTNARFGWQAHESAAISHVQVLACAHYASLLEAAQSYLRQQGLWAPHCAAFGMANPVTGDVVTMTNHPWTFSVSALREGLGVARLLLLNDFTALALALPQLAADQLHPIGGGAAVPHSPLGLIGPGTGLGVSGLIPLGGQNRWLPLDSEGGHVSLGATTDRERAVLQRLHRDYGHVSAERVLSGAGLLALHQALCDLEVRQAKNLTTPADVLVRALDTPSSTAGQALDLFCGFLGDVAGNLALTLGARGGIYIGGGIAPRMISRLESGPFRARFEGKGRLRHYLENVPTWVIRSPVSPALQGAAQALSLPQW